MIDLPSNLTWLDGDQLGVAIVQGDWLRAVFPSPVHGVEPFSEFVAPQAWVQYDKPCECACHQGVMARTSASADCDCRDGQRTWWVYLPCDGRAEYGRGLSRTTVHTDCCRTDLATIQVVPVVDRLTQPEQECVQVFDGYVVWYRFGVEPWPSLPIGKTFMIDPPPSPGRDFAVIVRLESA